ncbi:MAG TPA: zf-HC2 domain-containing protein, partial [Gemmatimonadales bacterium]|nr:zf-HC2 domain-containing protein [Gemmatimonadales bacterium]
MSHVDEGTLHALLDGELAPAEVLEVQTHFATCPACSSRLDDARKLLAETERLVTALEAAVPLGGDAATARTARPLAAPPPRRPVEPPARPAATPPLPAASPETLVLIPNNPTATEIRRSRLKVMGWAAAFLVVIGAGVLGVQMRNGFFDKKPAGTLKIRPEEFSTPGGSDLPPPTPAAKPQGALGLSIPESTAGQARNAPPAAAPAAQAPPVAKPAQPAGAAASGPAPATKPAQAPASGIFPSAEDRQAIVDRAAKATEELDRERSRERAAAATAALDAQRKQAAARQAAA